ncbi:MAG: c-type cytochrome [Polyangiales bacterium]
MRSVALSLVLAAAALAACKPPASSSTSSAEPSTSAPAPAATPEAEAVQIFNGRCAVCHGATGVGDGPGAAALTPRPRNFHDPAWQAATTDAQIETIIRQGGAAVGKSAAMPPNPDLADKPAVVAALRAHIRSFR